MAEVTEPQIINHPYWERQRASAVGSEGWVQQDYFEITYPDGRVEEVHALTTAELEIFRRQGSRATEATR